MTTAVKKKEQAPPPAMMADFAADAGAGFENADKDSYAIPFLRILQSGSKQCKKSDGAYIKGAEEGMLINTVTEALYDGIEGIVVIPVDYQRKFIEWAGTEPGSGLITVHEAAEGLELLKTCYRDDKNNDVLPDGHALMEAREHYVLVVAEDGSTHPAVISMSSTQMKKSRKWMSVMNGLRMQGAGGKAFTPPSFSHLYKLTTVPESNEVNSWMGWRVELVGPVESAEQYGDAKAFRAALHGGKAKADHASMADAPTGDDDDGGF